MKTILITGANGFVGTNLYEYLSADFRLIGLDITREGKYPPDDLYGWDELNRLPPVDAIIHLAGKAHDTANTSKEEEYFDVNLGLTQKIFDYFLQSQAEKFIFFSSVKAVADTVTGDALTEDSIPAPLTPYGRSKLAAEEYLREDGKTVGREDGKTVGREDGKTVGREDGKTVGRELGEPPYALRPKLLYVLRPAMIHGPGNKGNLNLLYKIVQKGIPWPLGAFGNRRSFASVGNVAFVVRQLLEKPIAPGIYNVADDDPVSTNDLIRLISRTLNHKSYILDLPKPILKALARTGDFLHLPLNSERLKKLTESYVVSNARLKSALGIEKMPVDAVEGLEWTVRSFILKV